MKKILTNLAGIACLVSPLITHASIIEIGTGYSTAGTQVSAADYKSVVDSAITSSVSVMSYDNVIPQNILGTGTTDFAFKSTVSFGVSAALAGNWEIRSGVDFGRGGAIFIDGVAQDFKTTDMWWAGSYDDKSQSFDVSLILGAGNHILQLYGLEGCCSGMQQAQFKVGSSNSFTSFSSNDNLVFTVPEPETYSMVLAGLGLMGTIVRRRKQM
ncbi:MAG: CCXG family PEP-CTERM protein [Propionivibrio sp.]|uniref:CCXG family PEP-CTERM protein n=1 Tax=Propionivibrio sp. TaxID=2212460 RepID=UPI001A60546D|nr:CCXG family PEP-CTERM protein [Propionivibrio sp.]MBL8413573.1 CCXG family PEP-CTERM protein [Propionivibrio sp.]